MGIVIRVATLCVLTLFAGCASVSNGDGEQPQGASEFEDARVKVKDLGSGYVRQGVAIEPKAISQVVPGLSRSDVRGLMGNPVDETSQQWWFYNISLPLESARDSLVCQFRIAFDSAGQVSSTQWRRPQCTSRYEELVEPEVQDITLSSDVLFAYDSATLSAEGLRELDLAANVVTNRMTQVDRVIVVGHSDRIGSDNYNVALSKRRAEAVRSHLISRGIDSYLISAEGRGAREPLVECPGSAVTAALKQCLQSNRRVQIMIYGQH